MLRQWFRVWQEEPGLRRGVCRAWNPLVEKLRGIPSGQRTRHIRGPLSAVITLLLNNGWDPKSATEWFKPAADPQDESIEWHFPDSAWTGWPD
eukprot:2101334-Pyramimonas_sp.AAC.1